jgi:hypothetical protein
VLIDSKVEELDFKIPRNYENIFICPLSECLRYLDGSAGSFICLTLGTSVLFPRVNLCRITAKEFYLAEIHACCFRTMNEAAFSIEYSRISLFRIDVAARSRIPIARFEKNKEIFEDSLKPGEKLMDPASYDSVGAWMYDGRAEYQIIPLPLCHAVTQVEKKYCLKWPESYYFLQKAGAAISVEGVHIYNLAGDKLRMDENDEPDQNDDPKDGTI